MQVLNLLVGVGLPCFVSAAVGGTGGSMQVQRGQPMLAGVRAHFAIQPRSCSSIPARCRSPSLLERLSSCLSRFSACDPFVVCPFILHNCVRVTRIVADTAESRGAHALDSLGE